jgi:hypothetical protein
VEAGGAQGRKPKLFRGRNGFRVRLDRLMRCQTERQLRLITLVVGCVSPWRQHGMRLQTRPQVDPDDQADMMASSEVPT